MEQRMEQIQQQQQQLVQLTNDMTQTKGHADVQMLQWQKKLPVMVNKTIDCGGNRPQTIVRYSEPNDKSDKCTSRTAVNGTLGKERSELAPHKAKRSDSAGDRQYGKLEEMERSHNRLY